MTCQLSVSLLQSHRRTGYDSPTSSAVCSLWFKFVSAQVAPCFSLPRQVQRGIRRHFILAWSTVSILLTSPNDLGGSSPLSLGSIQRLLRQPKARSMPLCVERESLLSRTRGSLPEQCLGHRTAAEYCGAKQKASLLLALYLTCG